MTMLMKPPLIAASERRFEQADFSPAALNRKLGDGPIPMTAEQKRVRMRQILAQTGNALSARIGLERIINGTELDSINYLATRPAASRSMCRLQLKDARSNLVRYAAGFLVCPGLLMTHSRVFGKPADAVN